MSRDVVMWEDQRINPLKSTIFSVGEDFDSAQWLESFESVTLRSLIR